MCGDLGISERVQNEAKAVAEFMVDEFLLDHPCTVRSTAIKFGMSKSKVHRLIHEVLLFVCPDLYDDVVVLLQLNAHYRADRMHEARRRA